MAQATQLLIRVPEQMHVPMHWHGANETHTVMRGTWTFEHEGVRQQLGPGGFNYIPAKMRHRAWTSEDALVFITSIPHDTLTCITGGIAEAFYGGVPADIATRTLAVLDDRLRSVVLQFCDRFGIGAA